MLMNVSDIIQRQVKENPEKTAIRFGDQRISYGELDTSINRTAGGLLKMGLKKRGCAISFPSKYTGTYHRVSRNRQGRINGERCECDASGTGGRVYTQRLPNSCGTG